MTVLKKKLMRQTICTHDNRVLQKTYQRMYLNIHTVFKNRLKSYGPPFRQDALTITLLT